MEYQHLLLRVMLTSSQRTHLERKRSSYANEWERQGADWFERNILQFVKLGIATSYFLPLSLIKKSNVTKYWSMNWSKMNFKYFLLLTHTGKTLTLFQPFPMVFDMYLLPSLEKAMAAHSSTLAWKIPWWAAVHGVVKSRTRLSDFTFTGGNPLQYSCLENPRDRGAWWAAIYGVAQLDTTEATWQQQQQQPSLVW